MAEITVKGRKAQATYLDEALQETEQGSAAFARLVFDDDGSVSIVGVALAGDEMSGARLSSVKAKAKKAPAETVQAATVADLTPPAATPETASEEAAEVPADKICPDCGAPLGTNVTCPTCVRALEAEDEEELAEGDTFTFAASAPPEIDEDAKPETSGPHKGLIRGKGFQFSPIGDVVEALDGREAVLPMQTARRIIADARARKHDIAITSMHEKGPHADKIQGYMVPSSLSIRGNAMVCDEPYWTKPAADAIRLRQYGPISPDFFPLRKPVGNRVYPGRLRCVSAVPVAAFHEMAPVSLSATAGTSTTSPTLAKKEPTMTLSTELAELLGIPADASEAEVTKAKQEFAAMRNTIKSGGLMTEAQMKAHFDNLEKERRTTFAAEEAKRLKIANLLDVACGKELNGKRGPTKITTSQRATFEALGESSVDQLEKILATMPNLEGPLTDFSADLNLDGGADMIQLSAESFGTMLGQLSDELGVDFEMGAGILRAQGFKSLPPPTQQVPDPQPVAAAS